MVNKLAFLAITFCFFSSIAMAQKDTSLLSKYNFDDFGGVVLLDSIVVRATNTGLDVADFIDMVKKDESFYLAFKNIRSLSYSADNQIVMYSKRQKEKARYFSKIRQKFEDNCRTMETREESVSGNYFKRKMKFRYYTAKLFDHLFFTHGKVCHTISEETKDTIINEYSKASKGMDKHIAELKKLIFSPGSKADVPMIGKKTAIFSEKMAKYYDYSITSEIYDQGIDCYVFTAKIKPQFETKKKDKTVIKYLKTYFEKSNYQVIARDYKLMYYGALFDFDIVMKIELEKFGNQYVPAFLEYKGFWDVPTKKPEISNFYSRFYDYKK